MQLRLEEIRCPKEKKYFIIALVFALLIWGVVIFTVVGAVVGLILALFAWLGNGLLVAHLRSSCVKVDGRQLPELYKTVEEVCSRLGVAVPEVYVLQSEGFLNAFALRHCGRDFVVLCSGLVEDFDPRGDEVRFYIGHEVGHLKSKHIGKQIFLLPATWLPLLGPAYHRACEHSCDRYGAFSVDSTDGAVRGLVVLASGKALAGKVDAGVFAEQAAVHRGFFVSWYELISDYQTLSQRAANLIAIGRDQKEPAYARNPFSYLLALFTLGGGHANVGGILVSVAVIAMLAAIAIPNLLRAKIAANDKLAAYTLKAMAAATEAYVVDRGRFPTAGKDLVGDQPSYMDNDYCGQTRAGYVYDCSFLPNGYRFTATPVAKGSSGSQVFTVSTGRLFSAIDADEEGAEEDEGAPPEHRSRR